MKFKQYQFLRDRAVAILKEQETHEGTRTVEAAEDSLMLAYMGDALYSLYVRERAIATGIAKVQVLHTIVTEFICAKSQAKALPVLETLFTEEEYEVARRARNGHVNVPKSATVQEYRASTAFEAVLGYLYCEGRRDRLQSLMEKAFSVTLENLHF